MKRIFLVAALILSASFAFAGSTRQKWAPGWDILNSPLNYKKSSVTWSVNPATSKLTVTYKLVGATPTKLYQVALNFYCSTFPETFGQFPNDLGGGACTQQTAQGVTATWAQFEVGVVLTDIYGDGSFTVVIGPVTPGTYDLAFLVRDGAGCRVIGGGTDGSVDFQSPGPFGTGTTITIP